MKVPLPNWVIDKDLKLYNAEISKSENILYRRNPEENIGNKLFLIGLLAEGLAIVFFVGFQVKIPINKPNPETANGDSYIAFAEFLKGNYIKIALYILGIICLLIHQYFIRNSFKSINELTTGNWKNNSMSHLFPNTLMMSSVEFNLRRSFFFLLAIIVGEIPIILITLEKILTYYSEDVSSSKMIYSGLTTFFIFACLAINFIVLIWDLLVFYALKIAENSEISKIDRKKGLDRILLFLFTGILSFVMWLMILIFVLEKNVIVLETLFYGLIITFSVTIIYRLRTHGSEPING